MSSGLAIPLFLVSLAVTLAAARTFAIRLDRLGVRFGFPEALIGLLTALAADGPEISSALFALAKGAHNVSVGVLVGSNAFNLAAMIGVSGLLAGCVALPRATMLLEGLPGAVVTLIAVALLLQWISAGLAAVLAAVVIVPYLVLVIGGRGGAGGEGVAGELGGAGGEKVAGELGGVGRDAAPRPDHPVRGLLALIVVDVGLIVAGSAGMVQAGLTLGDNLHISRAVLGVLVLAPLTSIPNALTGVRLGRAGRSAALVGETFNSNTINLAFGVIAPSLFVALGSVSATGKAELAWLIVMTLLTLLMLGRRRGMGRPGAAAIIALYLGFVALQLASA
jgi:cation:H+ antiporter